MRDNEGSLRFLLDASTVLASSLDIEATLAKVASVSVPAIADCCIVEVGESRAIAHVDPTKVEQAPRDAARIRRVLATGLPEVSQTMIVVPMATRGETIGVITLVAEAGRAYRAADLELAQGLADRAAFAIDNARLYQELQRAVRARDEVIAIVSHDLRNPLATVIAGTSHLLEDVPRERVHKIANMIVKSARRMETLIGDLLDLSRIDARRLVITPAPVDIGDVLAETVEAHAEVAAAGSVAVTTHPTDLVAYADRQRVLQILSNLVGNAIRFTPAGGSVTLSAERTGEHVAVSVTDTGSGIQAEQLPRVFERFWRGHRDDKHGTGLGLSIVKGLVEAHSGTVAVASRPGEGARFSFTLPATAAAVEQRRPVVLVIDDDPAIVRALDRALTGARYRVVTAQNGVEALERLRNERAQLIILDLMMPRMDGIEFRMLQSRDPQLAAIPTLVMTAFDKLGERISQFAPDACIQKPFRIKELVRLVDKVVSTRAAAIS